MSQITTHILDTSQGRPAAGVPVALYQGAAADLLATGLTNADGRLPGLLPAGRRLEPGTYRLHFSLTGYFEAQGAPHFYPFVDIWFTVGTEAHYHVPLLLNPFGYSTYRGS